jgi:hypothetical protein
MNCVVVETGQKVHINCIKIDNQGIHFAYSTPDYTEIFEMVRLARWLNEQHLVRSVNQAISMLLVEAAKVADDLWINVD